MEQTDISLDNDQIENDAVTNEVSHRLRRWQFSIRSILFLTIVAAPLIKIGQLSVDSIKHRLAEKPPARAPFGNTGTASSIPILNNPYWPYKDPFALNEKNPLFQVDFSINANLQDRRSLYERTLDNSILRLNPAFELDDENFVIINNNIPFQYDWGTIKEEAGAPTPSSED